MTTDWATSREIEAQPEIWRGWAEKIAKVGPETGQWITHRAPDEIWLCGAGTSAFIGDALADGLSGRLADIPVRAIATTDLVAGPQTYLRDGLRPLVVSFGRSGDSPETIGTLDILDRLCPDADRLNITCNGEGALARRAHPGAGQQRVIVLPDACHDQGFAMTSSYTTLLLSALACLSGAGAREIVENIGVLAKGAEALLRRDMSGARPERAVFLGSGPFTGTAREAALKVLELTAGQVVTCWDSSLGFRHGPKAIVNEQTAVFVFLSGDGLTRKYDQDIVDEIRTLFPKISVTSMGCVAETGAAPDIVIAGLSDDLWDTALFIIVAQLLSVSWSKSLGLNVDNPFQDGALTRVVSGVQLYR